MNTIHELNKSDIDSFIASEECHTLNDGNHNQSKDSAQILQSGNADQHKSKAHFMVDLKERL